MDFRAVVKDSPFLVIDILHTFDLKFSHLEGQKHLFNNYRFLR